MTDAGNDAVRFKILYYKRLFWWKYFGMSRSLIEGFIEKNKEHLCCVPQISPQKREKKKIKKKNQKNNDN